MVRLNSVRRFSLAILHVGKVCGSRAASMRKRQLRCVRRQQLCTRCKCSPDSAVTHRDAYVGCEEGARSRTREIRTPAVPQCTFWAHVPLFTWSSCGCVLHTTCKQGGAFGCRRGCGVVVSVVVVQVSSCLHGAWPFGVRGSTLE